MDIKKSPFILNARHGLEYLKWILSGRSGAAPHFYKRQVLRQYASKYHLTILVETGTFLGEMVNAQKAYFEKIYSIELAPHFYAAAKKRFAKCAQIEIIEGDSAQVLPKFAPRLNHPSLFWLDGHYSGGQTAKGALQTPIVAELQAIFQFCQEPFVVLIDDARLFVGQNDYPTLEELKNFVQTKNPNLNFEASRDIIRIYAKKDFTQNL